MNKQEAINEIDGYAVISTFVPRSTEVIKIEKAKEIISQIDEPQKVVVPKFVAEWIEEAKNRYLCLVDALVSDLNPTEVDEWLYGEDDKNQETFARAWLDGFEIEQEKLYTVELFNGQPLVEVNNILYFSSDLAASNAHVSKDKLEKAGFGWVFECDGVKVVEV
ncbi:TPA: DUF1642 domain-containing protein [Streptococcus suis]|nr:DUF1642 domain-containing protein [Streptococcus suis]HEM5936377.1 DUF1642 domain-containing protein [Streptococcus suis]HEM5940363.1 DUF1642 domain-containing protein [Streptococcus suis]HEM5946832.1 DUF1642 domain-containing protein [Streptococcus suis]HEM5951015.1 DUF1642 domain-containing protein [Streptococcus suis]